MNTKEYVQSLFKDYEESSKLRDFMEELQSNVDSRIASMVKKGIPEKEAFAKVFVELGDITVIADEMSLKRRQEVYQDAYMGIRNYMTPKRVVVYVIFWAMLVFGFVCALVAYLSITGVAAMGVDIPSAKLTAMTAAFGTLLIFVIISIGGLTFLHTTQESAIHYPLSKKRAAWYTLAAVLISSGVILFFLAYYAVSLDMHGFWSNKDLHVKYLNIKDFALMSALATQIPFMIPGLGLLAFLCLTEKNRHKPWAAGCFHKNHIEIWNDPAAAVRFGLFSGAIWIFAIGLFLTLGFIISFKFSWLVFIFAVAFQLLMQGLMQKPSSGIRSDDKDQA
jgi:hypothetical protein